MFRLILASLIVAASTAVADDPVELTSREGRFSAAFPADTKKETKKLPVRGGGEITLTTYTTEYKGAAYTVAFNDYPAALLTAKPLDVLKGVRDGNIGNGTLDEEKTGTFGKQKLPMRAFTYHKDKLFHRNLIVLDGTRLYQAMIVAESEDKLTDETAEAFYKAFQINSAVPPVVVKDKDGHFISKDGRYSVGFPGEPKEQKMMVPLAGTDKKITVNNQVVEVGKKAAYIVAYNDYPAGVLSPDSQDVLQGVRDGNMAPDGKLIDEEKGTFGPKKLPMREFTFTKNNVQFRNRIILDGTRLYQIMIVAEDKKSLTDAMAKKYFDSFKILAPTD